MTNCTPKLRDLRMQAGLSQNALSRLANLDRGTISSAENGKDVQELSIRKALGAIGTKLGREVSMDEVVGKK
jgi:transcriptional regulator with XRE-family HTH domain